MTDPDASFPTLPHEGDRERLARTPVGSVMRQDRPDAPERVLEAVAYLGEPLAYEARPSPYSPEAIMSAIEGAARSAAEVAWSLGLPVQEVASRLHRLERAGLVSISGPRRARRWQANERGRRWLMPFRLGIPRRRPRACPWCGRIAWLANARSGFCAHCCRWWKGRQGPSSASEMGQGAAEAAVLTPIPQRYFSSGAVPRVRGGAESH